MNYDPIKYLRNLHKKDLPKELADYLNLIIGFYEK
jgi:hypothetical protein